MMDLPELIIVDVGHGNCAVLQDTEGVVVAKTIVGFVRQSHNSLS